MDVYRSDTLPALSGFVARSSATSQAGLRRKGVLRRLLQPTGIDSVSSSTAKAPRQKSLRFSLQSHPYPLKVDVADGLLTPKVESQRKQREKDLFDDDNTSGPPRRNAERRKISNLFPWLPRRRSSKDSISIDVSHNSNTGNVIEKNIHLLLDIDGDQIMGDSSDSETSSYSSSPRYSSSSICEVRDAIEGSTEPRNPLPDLSTPTSLHKIVDEELESQPSDPPCRIVTPETISIPQLEGEVPGVLVHIPLLELVVPDTAPPSEYVPSDIEIRVFESNNLAAPERNVASEDSGELSTTASSFLLPLVSPLPISLPQLPMFETSYTGSSPEDLADQLRKTCSFRSNDDAEVPLSYSQRRSLREPSHTTGPLGNSASLKRHRDNRNGISPPRGKRRQCIELPEDNILPSFLQLTISGSERTRKMLSGCTLSTSSRQHRPAHEVSTEVDIGRQLLPHRPSRMSHTPYTRRNRKERFRNWASEEELLGWSTDIMPFLTSDLGLQRLDFAHQVLAAMSHTGVHIEEPSEEEHENDWNDCPNSVVDSRDELFATVSLNTALFNDDVVSILHQAML